MPGHGTFPVAKLPPRTAVLMALLGESLTAAILESHAGLPVAWSAGGEDRGRVVNGSGS